MGVMIMFAFSRVALPGVSTDLVTAWLRTNNPTKRSKINHNLRSNSKLEKKSITTNP